MCNNTASVHSDLIAIFHLCIKKDNRDPGWFTEREFSCSWRAAMATQTEMRRDCDIWVGGKWLRNERMHQLSEITRASPLTSQTRLAPLCRCSRCSYQCADIVFRLFLTLFSELFIPLAPLDILYGNTLACWLVSLFKALTGYVKTSNAPHSFLGSWIIPRVVTPQSDDPYPVKVRITVGDSVRICNNGNLFTCVPTLFTVVTLCFTGQQISS